MAATFKIFLNWRIPESWFLQLSKSGTIGIFLQKFDNHWKKGKCGLIYLLFVTWLWCWDPSISFLKIVIYRFDSTLTFCEIRFKVFLQVLLLLLLNPNLNLPVKNADILCEAPLFLSPHFVMVPICLSRLNSTSFSELDHYLWLPPLRFGFFMERILNWEGKQLSLS